MSKFYLTPKGTKKKKETKPKSLTRRQKLYYALHKINNGFVPCYVCDKHVELVDATIEHIIPLSRGGVQFLKNLSISHSRCNAKKADGFIIRKNNTDAIKRTVTYDVWSTLNILKENTI